MLHSIRISTQQNTMGMVIIYKGFRNDKTERVVGIIFTGGHKWKLMDLPDYRNLPFPELMIKGIAEAISRSKPNDIPGDPVHQTVTRKLGCPFKVNGTNPATLNLRQYNLKQVGVFPT